MRTTEGREAESAQMASNEEGIREGLIGWRLDGGQSGCRWVVLRVGFVVWVGL